MNSPDFLTRFWPANCNSSIRNGLTKARLLSGYTGGNRRIAWIRLKSKGWLRCKSKLSLNPCHSLKKSCIAHCNQFRWFWFHLRIATKRGPGSLLYARKWIVEFLWYYYSGKTMDSHSDKSIDVFCRWPLTASVLPGRTVWDMIKIRFNLHTFIKKIILTKSLQ